MKLFVEAQSILMEPYSAEWELWEIQVHKTVQFLGNNNHFQTCLGKVCDLWSVNIRATDWQLPDNKSSVHTLFCVGKQKACFGLLDAKFIQVPESSITWSWATLSPFTLALMLTAVDKNKSNLQVNEYFKYITDTESRSTNY